ncbi:AAA family ATPase [Pseudomonas sp. LB3P14]
MQQFIRSIVTTIPYTEQSITIMLNGKNLIVTGGNGTGKTSLITDIFKKANNIIANAEQENIANWRETVHAHKSQIHQFSEGSPNYLQYTNVIETYEGYINAALSGAKIEFIDPENLRILVASKTGLIEFFPAARQSQITDAKSASSFTYDKNTINEEIGNRLEEHLVNIYTRRAFARTEKQDKKLEIEISEWLNNFEKNLQYLMEDPSTKLIFNSDTFKFSISQKGKAPYTFQNLSSGYAAIFSIFSRFLMRAEYLKISPSEICGIAIIDELDAHLHVSLQRKILPFLTASFPGIQFLITTHSPFVITSIDNCVIYDISRREQVDELSSSSYEAVLEGLFGVLPSSDILQSKIKELVEISTKDKIDIDLLQGKINAIGTDTSALDEESRFFLNKAKFLITKDDSSN